MHNHISSKQADEVLVSVCLITYNHADYLVQCLESILNQITEFKFEILVHDDASTDETIDILNEYQDKYPDCIHVFFEKENQYKSGKYPCGYMWGFLTQYATGKYIACCEGDDYWNDNTKLQKQIEFLESHEECTEVCHAAEIIEAETNCKIGQMGMGNNAHYVSMEELIMNWNIPTASRVCRKNNLYEYNHYWLFPKPVGDFPSAIFNATKGLLYYDPTPRSVYRIRSKNSYTSKNQNWDINISNSTAWLKLLSDLDKATGKKYHQIFIKRAQSTLMNIMAHSKTPSGKELSSFNAEVFSSLSFSQKLKSYLNYFCSFLGFNIYLDSNQGKKKIRIIKKRN